LKRTLIVIIAISLIAILGVGCEQSTKPGKVKLSTFADSLSYSLGYIYGSQLTEVDFDINYNKFFKGIINAKDPSLVVMTEEEMDSVLNAFFENLQSQRATEKMEMRVKNQWAGADYMRQNANDASVVTTASGLQYRVIKAGTGKRVKDGDTVFAHFKGKFLDGEVFQSTYDMGEPMTFEIDQIFAGLNEGLKLMREGDIFELVVPDSLAYGDEGYDIIEPGSYLIFEVELISIKK